MVYGRCGTVAVGNREFLGEWMERSRMEDCMSVGEGTEARWREGRGFLDSRRVEEEITGCGKVNLGSRFSGQSRDERKKMLRVPGE